MSFINILETLLIGPLKLLFEIIFQLASRFIDHPGLVIIVLSLVMNVLVLPLYRRADAMQEESRDIEAKLHDGVAHIKRTFSGDERMMILQAYYRQNNYKPTDALKGSVSLLLEIPFFMAAYQFLSHLEILNGVSLGPIHNLGAPDGLLVIGSLTVNLLPILMTAINLISSALYLKGFPLKTKIQLYGMALFFLVFLYNSPSCLVFYWTLNNVFSLVKTIFYKLKNPKGVLRILTSLLGLMVLICGIFLFDTEFIKRKIFMLGLGLLLQLPVIIYLLKPKFPTRSNTLVAKPKPKLFILGCIFLTIFIGLLIPSTFIAASPQEFVDINDFYNPLWYIVSAACLAAGAFMIWLRVFYWLANDKGKVFFGKLVWILCGITLVNYMFFGTNLGVISSTLQYEDILRFSYKDQLINLLILAVVSVLMYLFSCKWSRAATMVLLTAVIALGGMSAVNVVTINKSLNEISDNYSKELPGFQLSKTGKNVVVLMLDRAMGEYVPYMFQEKPELEAQFAGFTYYANTISFGAITNAASPALYGGYEYTPVELNKRSDETLASKHNEALMLMPHIFSENDYKVTVCDPPYAGYQWIPDLSIYDDYPDINAYITKGKFADAEAREAIIACNLRNFFVFSFMKSMPLAIQPTIYNNGLYCKVASYAGEITYSVQITEGISKAYGVSSAFTEPYNVLKSLASMTEITEDEVNTFLTMANDTTHEPMLLQAPDYIPLPDVDNSAYDAANTDRFTVDGRTLKVDTANQMIHYHSNLAAMLQLGQWFDYLRENDVYDNTKIIIVADHGRQLLHLDELMLGGPEDASKDMERYFPLLMIKDFNSTEFTTSYEFMTNADVPTLAMKDLIEDPVNPFTGKKINSDEKTAHEQFITASSDWDVKINNGNTLLPSYWISVRDNIWDKDNWTFYDELLVLTEHAAP